MSDLAYCRRMNRQKLQRMRAFRSILAIVLSTALVAGPALAAPPSAAASGAPTRLARGPADVPTYRTQMPPPTTLNYRLSKGGWTGNGHLSWTPQPNNEYEARLEGRIVGIKVMTWVSTGAIDGAGVAPKRFTDTRRGKKMRVATFDDATGLLTYSGLPDEFGFPAGAQDRLSWMVQMAAIASAEPRRVATGQRISLFVSGARGDADVWSFKSLGAERVLTSSGQIAAIKLLREPRKPRDTRVEVWLDPSRHYLPVRAQLSNRNTDDAESDTLELLLEGSQPS